MCTCSGGVLVQRRFVQGLQNLDTAHYPLATIFFRKALEAAECTVHPTPAKDMVNVMNNLSVALHRSGMFGEAWSEYKKAMQLSLSLDESDGKYVDLMYVLSNTAALLHQAKEDSKSMLILKTLNHARLHVLTRPDEKVCDILGNLGNTLMSLNQRRAAWDIFCDAFKSRLQLSPNNHGAIANLSLALGNLCLTAQDYARALIWYKKGITRLIGALPDYYHPILPGLYRNASVAYLRLGYLDKATMAQTRANKIESK